jgi:hypothetical protein
MPFIQAALAQSESASPKAATLYVYNMPPKPASCCLSAKQMARRKQCKLLLNSAYTYISSVSSTSSSSSSSSSSHLFLHKARGLTTPRSSQMGALRTTGGGSTPGYNVCGKFWFKFFRAERVPRASAEHCRPGALKKASSRRTFFKKNLL